MKPAALCSSTHKQSEFVRRRIAAIQETQRTGSGVPAEPVIARLETKLNAACQANARRAGWRSSSRSAKRPAKISKNCSTLRCSTSSEQRHRQPQHPARALQAIRDGIAFLEISPFACRKAGSSPFQRELVIPFRRTEAVALFEIVDSETIIIGAMGHQREDEFF